MTPSNPPPDDIHEQFEQFQRRVLVGLPPGTDRTESFTEEQVERFKLAVEQMFKDVIAEFPGGIEDPALWAAVHDRALELTRRFLSP